MKKKLMTLSNILKALGVFVSIIVAGLIVLLVVDYYHEYRVSRTFHICNSGHNLNLYVFEKAKIGDETAYEVLMRALDGDTSAIVAYSSVDLTKTMNDFDPDQSFYTNQYIGQYALGIYTIIDKIGQEKFLRLCRNLPNEKRENIEHNMYGGKYGDPVPFDKYSYIFKNL